MAFLLAQDPCTLPAGEPPAPGCEGLRSWSPPHREADFQLQMTFN